MRSACGLFWCLTVLVSASADPYADLARKLGDPVYRVRMQAASALENAGVAALPALQAISHTGDTEARSQAIRIRRAIELKVLQEPKRVSLAFDDRPLAEVVAELERVSGYVIKVDPRSALQRLTVRVHDVPFWQAIDTVSRASGQGLTPNIDEQTGAVHLLPQRTYSPFVTYSGPFRIVATNISYQRTLSLAALPLNATVTQVGDDNGLTLSLMIQAEPKSPIVGANAPQLTLAEDERKLSLLPRLADDEQTTRFYYDGATSRNYVHYTTTMLTRPDRESRRIERLEGRMLVQVLSGMRVDASVDGIAPGMTVKTVTGEEAEITVEEVTQSKTDVAVKVTVRKVGPMVNGWANSAAQRLELEDANGRKYRALGPMKYFGNTGNTFRATLLFSSKTLGEIGPAVKLSYRVWETSDLPMEFRFRDVPLP